MKKTNNANRKCILFYIYIFGLAPISKATTIFSTESFGSTTDFGGEVTRFVQGGRFQNLANSMIDGAGTFLIGNVNMWDGGIEYYMLDTNSGDFPTDILASGTGQSAQIQDTGDVVINGLGNPLRVYELTFEFENTFQVPTNDAYVFGFRLTPALTPTVASIVALGFAGTDNEKFHAPSEQFSIDGEFIWDSTDGIDQSLSFFFTGTIPEPSIAILLASGVLLFFRRQRH